jgi:hypothetical protein
MASKYISLLSSGLDHSNNFTSIRDTENEIATFVMYGVGKAYDILYQFGHILVPFLLEIPVITLFAFLQANLYNPLKRIILKFTQRGTPFPDILVEIYYLFYYTALI